MKKRKIHAYRTILGFMGAAGVFLIFALLAFAGSSVQFINPIIQQRAERIS
jgi:hypothetical protein